MIVALAPQDTPDWWVPGYAEPSDPLPSSTRGATSAGVNVADNTFVTGQSTTSSEAITARPESYIATPPVGITVPLSNGQTEFVTSVQQINSLVSRNLLSASAAQVYRAELRTKQSLVRARTADNNRTVKEI